MAKRVLVRDLTNNERRKLLSIVRRGSGSVVQWRRALRYPRGQETRTATASPAPATGNRQPATGNRQPAIQRIAIPALTPPRRPAPFRDRRVASGETPTEALRALKRRLANVVFRALVADAEAPAPAPRQQAA